MTYVSTLSGSLMLRQSVQQVQAAYNKAQTELSTGKAADLGLALGYSTGRTVSLTQDQAHLQSLTDTNALVATRLSSTQTALGAASTAAQAVASSLLSTATDAGSATALANQARSGLQGLTDALNTTVEGKAIFGGINTDAPPLANYFQSPAGTAKQAVDAAFTAAFGVAPTDPAAANISGSDMQNFLNGQFAALFSNASWGSNWSTASDQTQTSRISPSQTAATSVSANDSSLRQLAQGYTMLVEYAGSSLSGDAKAAVNKTAQALISAGSTGLTGLQAGIGIVQNQVTQANTTMSAQMDVMKTSLGDLEEVDPYEASTRVSALQTQLQAAYQLTTQLHQMSLLNYLTPSS